MNKSNLPKLCVHFRDTSLLVNSVFLQTNPIHHLVTQMLILEFIYLTKINRCTTLLHCFYMLPLVSVQQLGLDC
jgi:hypothetical protein